MQARPRGGDPPAAGRAPRRVAALALALGLAALGTAPGRGGAPGDETTRDLASEAFAVLQARCFECHGPDARRVKGGLRLGGRDALLAGGASGPAIDPDEPGESLLLRAVRRAEPGFEMPPDEPLPPEELALLERWVAGGAPWPSGVAEASAGPSRGAALTAGEQLFAGEVLPLLRRSCFPCHGPAALRPKGGLRLSGRGHLLQGGSRGPAVVPGDSAASLLHAAVRGGHAELSMPPDEPLAPAEVELLARWIDLGAPWPEGLLDAELATAPPAVPATFLPVRPADPPRDTSAGPDAHPIDAFLAAARDRAGVGAAPPAGPRELMRRLYLDLTGLPPALEDVERFAADPSPAAYGALVDELLGSAAYGERMARLWLDVVRFAESNGFERDAAKPYAWRYRDWVVEAFRSDLPYDAFLTAQLAGDERPDSAPDAVVATGFWRLGEWDDEPNDPREAEFDELDDSLRAISEGMLGVTIGCARCHDHRFDPFPQEDYYGVLAHFRNVAPYEDARHALDSSVLVPVGADPGAIAAWEAASQVTLEGVRTELDAILEEPHRRLFEAQVGAEADPVAAYRRVEFRRALTLSYRERQPALRQLGLPSVFDAIATLPFDERRRAHELAGVLGGDGELDFAGDLRWALAVRERPGEPLPTHVLGRGRASTPLEEVPPATPPILGPVLEPVVGAGAAGGRRARLATWIADAENPLTARVWVNRLWQMHFGVGLVSTPDDFGNAGEGPTHPELLDWLAGRLVALG